MENKKFYVIVAFAVFAINVALLLWLGWLNYDVMSKGQVFGFVLLGVLNLPLFVLCKPFPSLADRVRPKDISPRAILEMHGAKLLFGQLGNILASLLLLSSNRTEMHMLPIAWMVVLMFLGAFFNVFFEKVNRKNKYILYFFRTNLFFILLSIVGLIFDWDPQLRMLFVGVATLFIILIVVASIVNLYRQK